MKGWLVDGSLASRQEFVAAQKLADGVRCFRRRPHWFAGRFDDQTVVKLRATSDLRFHPDVQLQPCTTPRRLQPKLSRKWFRSFCNTNQLVSPGLNEVVEQIGAPQAWSRATGSDTYIAIVDSGINGLNLEFPAWKKAGGWSYDNSFPWNDSTGHGTMCAVIAAGCPRNPLAKLCGVAPDALLYSCKTDYQSSTIIDAYDWIQDQHDQHGRPIIVSNSFGFETTTPPEEDGEPVTPDHPFVVVLRELVARKLPVVFAAGNNHPENKPRSRKPDRIWAWNSLPEVFTVAEVDRKERVRPYSSRGPGQWASASHPKPDCAAPAFGWVLIQDQYSKVIEGWGTSGAAPQAAGLLAMLKEQRPDFEPAVLYQRIRDKARKVPQPWNCVGSGILDCWHAVY